MERESFTQYVHWCWVDGEDWWSVGKWDQDRGQYYRPFDATERRVTGCFAEFAKRACGMQRYRSRRRALRRARYLFGGARDERDLEL